MRHWITSFTTSLPAVVGTALPTARRSRSQAVLGTLVQPTTNRRLQTMVAARGNPGSRENFPAAVDGWRQTYRGTIANHPQPAFIGREMVSFMRKRGPAASQTSVLPVIDGLLAAGGLAGRRSRQVEIKGPGAVGRNGRLQF